jgi:hypothetical protein
MIGVARGPSQPPASVIDQVSDSRGDREPGGEGGGCKSIVVPTTQKTIQAMGFFRPSRLAAPHAIVHAGLSPCVQPGVPEAGG